MELLIALLIENCVVLPVADVQVPAQRDGIIVEMQVEEGQRVSRDETLAVIDDRILMLERERAMAELRFSESILEVYEPLRASLKERIAEVPDQADGLDRILDVIGEWAAANRVRREAAVEMIDHQIATLRIVAPRDGVLAEVHKEVGEFILRGESFCRLIDDSELIVEGKFKPGHDEAGTSPHALRERLEGAGEAFRVKLRNEEVAAEFHSISPVADEEGDLTVRAVIDNAEAGYRYYPGMEAEMALPEQ